MSNHTIQCFDFQGNGVRVFQDAQGAPWFVMADVCRVLEIANPRDAASRLDDDEKNTVGITDGTPGNPNQIIINESGLYSLILTSRKAEAKAFKKWVTGQVLPSIRKTGTYNAMTASSTDLITLLENTAQALRERDAKIAALAPKADAWANVVDNVEGLLISKLAKMLDCVDGAGRKVGPHLLFDVLRENEVIYKEKAGYNMPYQEHVKAGRFVVKLGRRDGANGEQKPTYQIYITPKGVEWLIQRLRAWGYRVKDLSYELLRVQ